MHKIQRSIWCVGALLLALGAGFSLPAIAADTGTASNASTRLVLLGTAGGPSAKAARAQPSSAIVIGNDVYVIDAGDGVARQMILAGISPRNLRAVFITHQH